MNALEFSFYMQAFECSRRLLKTKVRVFARQRCWKAGPDGDKLFQRRCFDALASAG